MASSSLAVMPCMSSLSPTDTLFPPSLTLSFSLAYRAGVTTAITSPQHVSFVGSLSTAFSLGALHGLETGAVVQDVVALHATLAHGDAPSVSSEIAALRRYILHPPGGEAARCVDRLRKVRILVSHRNTDSSIFPYHREKYH